MAKSIRAARGEKPEAKAPKTEQEILDEFVPSQYHEFADVFSSKEVEELPPHRPYNHAIDVEEGKTPPHGPIYSLSLRKLEALQEYINTEVRKGFI